MWKLKTAVIAMCAMAWFIAGCVESSPLEAPTPEDVGESTCDAAFVPPSDAGLPEMPDAAPMLADSGIIEAADAGASDAGPGDAGPPPRCIGNYAEGVAIFAAESYLALRAHAEPEESAEVTAWPWQTSLGSVRPVAREVEWRLEGDTALFRAEPLVDPRGRRLHIGALGDAFDMGAREPYVSIRACVTNPCPEHAADGSPCHCEPEVCSPLILAAAVPVLDGRWTVSEDGAEMGTFTVTQSGRVLSGWPYDFPFQIEGVGISGGELGILVTGAIATDRRSVSGLRFTEDGDVIGPWSARRVD